MLPMKPPPRHAPPRTAITRADLRHADGSTPRPTVSHVAPGWSFIGTLAPRSGPDQHISLSRTWHERSNHPRDRREQVHNVSGNVQVNGSAHSATTWTKPNIAISDHESLVRAIVFRPPTLGGNLAVPFDSAFRLDLALVLLTFEECDPYTEVVWH